MAFYEFEDNLVVQEEYVSYIVQSVLKNCKLELGILERDVAKLEKFKHHSLELATMMPLHS